MFCILLELYSIVTPTKTIPGQTFTAKPVEDLNRPFTKKLLFLPESKATTKMMKEGASFETPETQPVRHQTEKYGNLVADLQFENETEIPRNLKFQIITSKYDDHYENGVIFAQYAVTKIFINYWLRKRNTSKAPLIEKFYLQLLPRPYSVQSVRYETLHFLERVFPYLFVGLVSFTTLCVVQDMERKIKSFFSVFEMPESTYWLSWFLTSFLIGLLTCLAITAVMSIDKDHNGTFVHRNPVPILFILLLYLVNVLSYSFLVACLGRKARNAAVTGGVIFLVTRYSAPSLLHYTKSRILALATGCVIFHTGSLVLDILFANERQ
ncbi:ATP-binding cassette sub-family A member 2, partial [Biomphalaria pfeifferi]